MIGRIFIAAMVCVAASVSAFAQEERHPEELRLLRAVLPEDLIAYASLEAAARENLVILSDGGLAFGVLEGQRRVNNGMRAEMSVDYPFAPGDDVRYCWRFQLAREFAGDPQDRWMIAGQWHDQPNFALGETWDRHPSNSPPIALAFAEVEGDMAFALVYGRTAERAEQQVSEPILLEREVWHDICVEVHWSEGAEGAAVLSLNGRERARMQGPNMNNAAPHFFKVGLYRHPDIAGSHWVAVADVEIGSP